MKRIFNHFLDAAISNDNVKLSYWLILFGADVNHKISYMYEVYEDYGLSCVETCHEWKRGFMSPLEAAKSDAMRRLLEHFGGLPTDEAQKLWDEQAKKKQEIEAAKLAAKEQKMAKKRESDNNFVNRIIR